VFLLDIKEKIIWSSPDQTLLPLMALLPSTPQEGQHTQKLKKASFLAHAHVTLLSIAPP
jgi:hypothetical protein